MNTLIASFAIATFSFGTAVFYVLSCIERRVLKLGLNQNATSVKDDDARFVHQALKRLSPLLPPSNGFVILFGTVALIYLVILSNWNWLTLLPLAFYWLMNAYIIGIGKIAVAVKNLNTTPSEGNINDVKRDLHHLIVNHHLGLIANLGTVILTFWSLLKVA